MEISPAFIENQGGRLLFTRFILSSITVISKMDGVNFFTPSPLFERLVTYLFWKFLLPWKRITFIGNIGDKILSFGKNSSQHPIILISKWVTDHFFGLCWHHHPHPYLKYWWKVILKVSTNNKDITHQQLDMHILGVFSALGQFGFLELEPLHDKQLWLISFFFFSISICLWNKSWPCLSGLRSLWCDLSITFRKM